MAWEWGLEVECNISTGRTQHIKTMKEGDFQNNLSPYFFTFSRALKNKR